MTRSWRTLCVKAVAKIAYAVAYTAAVSACSSATVIPTLKTADILCPKTLGSEEGDKPLDIMLVSKRAVVMVCGHREDTRTTARRMRVSEAEAIYFRSDVHDPMKNVTTSVWQAGETDVRYLQFFPKKKRIEIVYPVFPPTPDAEKKPVPVLLENIDCTASGCIHVEKKCVFKKDLAVHQTLLPKLKKKQHFAKWLQDEDSVNRATLLFLAAASGDAKAQTVMDDTKLAKLKVDGFFEKTMQSYRSMLSDVKKLCHQ